MAHCAFCGVELPIDATQCPSCHHAAGAEPAPDPFDPDVYDLSEGLDNAAAEIPVEWEGGAVYTLELPARCPACRASIRTIRVLRLKRTQVTFTSTLPRSGRALVCPECGRILSVELGSL
jgi:hypothetical protein